MTDLAPFAGPGRFWKGNVHTHSTRSDGALPVETVCARYRDAGYDFLSITDHFMERFDWPVVDTRGERTAGFTTIIGAELHAPATSHGERWHILAVGLPLDFERNLQGEDGLGEDGPALALRASQAGAFVGIAHPAWYGLTMADARTLHFADAVEVYNHTSQVRTDRGDGWYLLDALLNEGTRHTAIAVDDAHFHCDDGFGGWINVRAESCEPEALLAAMKAGRFYASQGPEIREVTLTADTIEVACSPARAVIAVGRASKSSQVVTEAGGEVTRAVLPREPLGASPWLRLAVVDAAGRRAWTNPVWLDVV